MKISTKGRYALRLMIYIAANSNGKPVSIKDVAKNEDISDKYLEQIISILNSGGLVRSVRGPQGGYLLRKAPEDITVGAVLRLTEGTLAPVACVERMRLNVSVNPSAPLTICGSGFTVRSAVLLTQPPSQTSETADLKPATNTAFSLDFPSGWIETNLKSPLRVLN